MPAETVFAITMLGYRARLALDQRGEAHVVEATPDAILVETSGGGFVRLVPSSLGVAPHHGVVRLPALPAPGPDARGVVSGRGLQVGGCVFDFTQAQDWRPGRPPRLPAPDVLAGGIAGLARGRGLPKIEPAITAWLAGAVTAKTPAFPDAEAAAAMARDVGALVGALVALNAVAKPEPAQMLAAAVLPLAHGYERARLAAASDGDGPELLHEILLILSGPAPICRRR